MKTATNIIALLAFVSALLALPPTATAAGGTSAQEILDATGIKGGLIIHLGCGNGKLTAALHASDAFLVQGLEANPKNVEAARQHIQSLDLYGAVSVEPWAGKTLPYANNLANLVVAEDSGGVAVEEAMRVLAPGGVLYANQGGAWKKTVKPRPANIDEWTHYLYDASGNPVAHDEVVAPPGRLQWTAGPSYARSHEHTPSIFAMVASGGRIFYITDEAPRASIRATPQWTLMAQDAFNGVELWQRPLSDWFPHIVGWTTAPTELERRLVAIGDRVYVTLGLHAPVSVLDATTGQTLNELPDTVGTGEILWHKGTLLLSTRTVTPEKISQKELWKQLVTQDNSPAYNRDTAGDVVQRLKSAVAGGDEAILAFDTSTGHLLWKKDGADVANLKAATLSASGNRVFYQAKGDVVCLDLKSGKSLWAVASEPMRVVSGDTVYCASDKKVTALAADTGKARWGQPSSLAEIKELFVAGGSLWEGGFQPAPGKRSPAWGPYFVTQRDLATGEVKSRIEPENPGHHHRCYVNKATDRYILGGRRGTEFIDLTSGEVLWNSWARGVCKYGVMPANGLLYVPPHACGCYIAAKLVGFNALAPRINNGQPANVAPAETERGPAYGQLSTLNSHPSTSTDWPGYRNDANRSGFTATPVPVKLKPAWQVKVGGTLTSPTIAGGKVLVASTEEHSVQALDANSGRTLWRFTAGARVDSAPTLYQGTAIFGCRDGYVYCLRASDGALAWRVRAAREERLIPANGQIESVSPVHGSVLIQDNVAYVTAGRSSYMDGGIDLCRIDPRTGKILSRTPICSPDPQTGKQPPASAPGIMPGERSDILSGDGSHVYLRDLVFSPQGTAEPAGNNHLFSITGFLDDAWAHRAYWIHGKECSIATGCTRQEKGITYGRLLVFDPNARAEAPTYGYGRATIHWSNQLLDGPYRLFARLPSAEAPQWTKALPISARALLLADKTLFVAGPMAGAIEKLGRDEKLRGGSLMAVSAQDGTELAQYPLDSSPVFDGMAAAEGRLFLSTQDGGVVCFGKSELDVKPQ